MGVETPSVVFVIVLYTEMLLYCDTYYFTCLRFHFLWVETNESTARSVGGARWHRAKRRCDLIGR